MHEPRPKINDAMELEAAKVVAARMGDIELAESIAKQYRYPMDGFELAKRLDRFECWETSRDEMESLDDLDGLVSKALRQAETEWFDRTKPQPPLEIGAKIRFTQGIGAITGISDYSPAKYLVKLDGQDDSTTGERRYLINFEDALAA